MALLLDTISSNLKDNGQQVYLDDYDWDVLAGIEEQLGCQQTVEFHQRVLVLVVDYQNCIHQCLVDERSNLFTFYIFFFRNCLTKGFNFSFKLMDMSTS